MLQKWNSPKQNQDKSMAQPSDIPYQKIDTRLALIEFQILNTLAPKSELLETKASLELQIEKIAT